MFLNKKQTFAKNENIGTPKPRSQKKAWKINPHLWRYKSSRWERGSTNGLKMGLH
jgi:hypothetical protein